ncbi:hypothetical protein [Actinosynnema sp. NPDC020468]|uniref:hypothetical protein n=1 Tax=Actinosynnema sp. NPDC020468 TaxID=3154488 RepID=UPI0033C61DBB
MNTELVSRAEMVPEQVVPASTDPADALAIAVDRALATVGPADADASASLHAAEDTLLDALRRTDPGSDDALAQAVACAEAAAEHLRYGELQEARLLLVASRGRLVGSHSRRS